MNKLFLTYEVGSLPKISARVKAIRGNEITKRDTDELKGFANKAGIDVAPIVDILERQQKEKRQLTPEEKARVIDINALINLRLQERSGLDIVYDGEARRTEMYLHVAQQIDGFENLPEMIRSRGPDSWRASACIAPPKLKDGSIPGLLDEFNFVNANASHAIKVPIDDPHMIAIMSDNRYYTELLGEKHKGQPRKLRYEAKLAFTLALAKNVIRPQVESLVRNEATWIQLDAPAATLDIEHIQILIEGINAVVEGIDGVRFSLHICYPRRISLTDKNGYELLFPHLLNLDHRVTHLSLELANADEYAKDLAPFAQHQSERRFEIGLGAVNITLEQQERGVIETPELVRNRILTATEILGDPKLVYPAPDCGLRQVTLERAIQLYEILVEGAELARKG